VPWCGVVTVGRRSIAMRAVRHGRGALGMREEADPGERAPLLFGPHLLRGVRIQVRGDLDPHACDFAGTAVALLARAAHRPVRSARVRLTQLRHGALGDVGVYRPAGVSSSTGPCSGTAGTSCTHCASTSPSTTNTAHTRPSSKSLHAAHYLHPSPNEARSRSCRSADETDSAEPSVSTSGWPELHG
jgi:hypothetical protein